ncbi:MAG TPA: hypothetical protein VE986_04460 [Hyphomicrobiales bacterium]|nr:hypothetical protein [Hyphomicrobiales bacterium]
MKKIFRYTLSLAACFAASDAFAFTASQAPLANGAAMTVKVYHRHRHVRGGPNFKHWCAYNCYAISRCYRGCLGVYGYRFYPYDQDLPFRYRYDHDASPIDNAFAITAPPLPRLFERAY